MSNPNAALRAEGWADRTGQARYFLLTELLDRPVLVGPEAVIGKLQDFVFRDDPKYAEVTHLVVRRPFGRQPWRVPWERVERIDERGVVLQEGDEVSYPDFEPSEGQLLLRDQVLDKRILDTKGYALNVVYDIQLVSAGKKLFVVAADVSRSARRRRSALFRFGGVPESAGGQFEERIPWRYVQSIGPDVTSTKGDVRLTVPRETLGEIRPEDLADILEDLSREQRLTIFNVLSSESAAKALEETEPRVQREILHDADAVRVERIFAHLSPVAIAGILSALPREEAEDLGRHLKGEVASKVRDIMEKHEVPASTFALPRFLAFPEYLTVPEAFDRFRAEAPKSDVTMYIYVVDADLRVEGVVDINELLQARPSRRLGEIMTKRLVSVPPGADLSTVLELFRRYRFRALPVIDASGKMVGVVREKDAFLLEESAEMPRRL
jgi:CBS domain-containing protein/sporulation protein YlmC with PRC-barrel domain